MISCTKLNSFAIFLTLCWFPAIPAIIFSCFWIFFSIILHLSLHSYSYFTYIFSYEFSLQFFSLWTFALANCSLSPTNTTYIANDFLSKCTVSVGKTLGTTQGLNKPKRRPDDGQIETKSSGPIFPWKDLGCYCSLHYILSWFRKRYFH